MPSFTDQAQNAVQSSPLAKKVPLDCRPAGPGVQNTNTTGSPSSTTPHERLIAASKDVAIDYDKIAKDTNAISKELSIWGQTRADDLEDVTGRLARFQSAYGSLAASLAEKLHAARLPLEELRDTERVLAALRSSLHEYEQVLDEFGTSSDKNEWNIDELRTAARAETGVRERNVQRFEREVIRKSEKAKWEAIREYAEELLTLAQASERALQVLSPLPPHPTGDESSQETGDRSRRPQEAWAL